MYIDIGVVRVGALSLTVLTLVVGLGLMIVSVVLHRRTKSRRYLRSRAGWLGMAGCVALSTSLNAIATYDGPVPDRPIAALMIALLAIAGGMLWAIGLWLIVRSGYEHVSGWFLLLAAFAVFAATLSNLFYWLDSYYGYSVGAISYAILWPVCASIFVTLALGLRALRCARVELASGDR